MLRFVEVAVGEGGSVACSRCDRSLGPPSYHELDHIVADVAAVVADWPGGPGPNVALGGAEPWGHRDLPHIVAAAVSSGVRRLRLDTDASRLATGGSVGALSAGVRHVRVTLLGGTPGVHDALVGRAGALDATLEGMRRFTAEAAEQGLDVSVSARIPVCRHNAHDLPDAVAVAAEAGARHVVLDVRDGGLDLAGAMPWIDAACDSGTVNSVWVEVVGVPWCLAGTRALHVAPELEAHAPGVKPASCERCAFDVVCPGVPAGTAGDTVASLVRPVGGEELASRIRDAYLAPHGPGELE